MSQHPDVAPHVSGAEALAREIEAVQKETAALVAAQATGRRIRLVLFLLAIILVGVTLYKFYALKENITSEASVKALAAEAQKRLEANSKEYMVHVQRLVDKTSPVLTEAVYKQAKKDMPSFFEKMDKEREIFLKNLEDRLAIKIDESYQKVLANHEKLLEKEFKGLDNPVVHQRMIQNLTVAVDHLARKYYIHDLQDEVQTLFDHWDAFPAADPVMKGQEPLEDQLTGTLFQLLTQKLANSNSATR